MCNDEGCAGVLISFLSVFSRKLFGFWNSYRKIKMSTHTLTFYLISLIFPVCRPSIPSTFVTLYILPNPAPAPWTSQAFCCHWRPSQRGLHWLRTKWTAERENLNICSFLYYPQFKWGSWYCTRRVLTIVSAHNSG